MPGRKGAKNVGSNIREAHKGKTYQKTKAKFGKKKADRQAIAIGFSEAGLSRKKKKKKSAKKRRANRAETEQ
jgi:hypothetical protein